MLVIKAGLIIDGIGPLPQKDKCILIKGHRIIDIFDYVESSIPEDAQLINALDAIVMPGLIDTHVHIMSNAIDDPSLSGKERMVTRLPGTYTLHAYRNVNLCLAAGFTTLRDMGCRDFVDLIPQERHR